MILYFDLVTPVRPTVRNNVDDINLTGRHDILKILHKKRESFFLFFFISDFSPNFANRFVTLNHGSEPKS